MKVFKNQSIRPQHFGMAHHAHVRLKVGRFAARVKHFKSQRRILFAARRRVGLPDDPAASRQMANRVRAGILLHDRGGIDGLGIVGVRGQGNGSRELRQRGQMDEVGRGGAEAGSKR